MRARTRRDRGPSAFLAGDPPRILAHRGLALDAPENTLAAFERAVRAGARYLETDVHATRDGVAVLSHDPDLARVAGRGERIADLTLEELRGIPLPRGARVPTLAEALEAFPDSRFNIDVKALAAAPPTARAILDAGAVDRVLVGSFDEGRRRAAVDLLPGVATSASAALVRRALLAVRLGARTAAARVLAQVDSIQVPLRSGPVAVVTPSLVRAFRSLGVEVHVWTINEPRVMDRLLDWGVDGIVTDRADLALEVVAARSR